jgi:anti-sigma B factor antagonist
MTNSLQINVQSEKDRAVMYLQGRVSIETSPDFRDHLLALLRQPTPRHAIAVDLSDVSYMDTSGLATLIQALKVGRITGITIRIQGLQDRILHLFQATGIESLFEDGRIADQSPTSVGS